jgi:predicted acylesterase/phospholipase RssA
MLAGGGIKAGYQAGCLQVLLDEVGPEKLRFDYIDAASAGCFNAAMICSGKTGTEIADAWRRMNPFDLATFNLPELRKGPYARSIATLDGLRKVFVGWGLDFERIREPKASQITFNYFNFSTKEVVPLPNTQLDEDYLCACVALIFWFPPIERGGETLVDAVFATDSNLSEALKRGTDEIWAIWSVAKLPEIRSGLIAQYFHMLEQSADANFFSEWERIATSGSVQQHLVRQEVPIHYLFNFSRDRMAATIDLGIADMRRYCRDRGLLPQTFAVPAAPQEPVTVPATSVRFTEKLCGFYFVLDGDRFKTEPLVLHVTLATGDLDTFVQQPEHQAQVTWGVVTAPELGGDRPVTTGDARILVDERAPAPGGEPGVIIPGNKRMLYTARFQSDKGTPYLLEGKKYAVDGPGKSAWRDTTTLYVRLFELDAAGAAVRLHGAGIVTLSALGFLAQLASFRTSGTHGALATLNALRRFFQFFIRQCWDVYARGLLDYAPF